MGVTVLTLNKYMIMVWNSYHSFYFAMWTWYNKQVVGICYCIKQIADLVLIFTGSPLPPARPTVHFNSPGQSFTVSWNNITSPFNGYTVAVSPSNPCTQPPVVSCNTVYVCSGWSATDQPNVFEFSVSAVCGSVVGGRSAAASVNLQGTFHWYIAVFPGWHNLLLIHSCVVSLSPVNVYILTRCSLVTVWDTTCPCTIAC